MVVRAMDFIVGHYSELPDQCRQYRLLGLEIVYDSSNDKFYKQLIIVDYKTYLEQIVDSAS